MPRRADIKKILVIGSGPIVIGQAGEFDYSGTQAVKALKEEGYQVILINSNPATIMTDTDFADKVFIEPITLPYLEKIISEEKPNAILPTVGGQTALNMALQLSSHGILKKHNIELIGANEQAIVKAEDRELFKKAMENIGAKVPASGIARSMEEARALQKEIGFPLILRPSFTLGGSGGGVCYNKDEFENMIPRALQESPVQQVLLEQSVIGWKEIELELMRDSSDNVVVICSIENIDAMGVHTGDSITVAPQQTLSDVEYQDLRDLGIAVIREIGVDTGGSNIQFAVNPRNGETLVIEMNPRVSRSSALASKATGFPIARIAAKLSVGYTLDEIPNDITQKTPASFEPTIDYIVTKVPRFAFEKFPDSKPVLDTQMRSVGEVMSLGRTFLESFQKALRSLETGRLGWGADGHLPSLTIIKKQRNKNTLSSFLRKAITTPSDERIFYLRHAFEEGLSIEEIYKLSHIDPWFLHQLQRLIDFEKQFIKEFASAPQEWQKQLLHNAKQFGYSDKQIAWLLLKFELHSDLKRVSALSISSPEYLQIAGNIARKIQRKEKEIFELRLQWKLFPSYKRVDTCAAEFESFTPYLYSSYEQECEAEVNAKTKVMILGGGPNRIGQGIEFDYCCCHAAFALEDLEYESIMVNCNPETVSTDYDTSDRLYFEPLTFEDIIAIYQKENQQGNVKGVILQFGGQTPLSLAHALDEAGVSILGTSVENIDRAEDREKFNNLIQKLKLKQPQGAMASSMDEALKKAQQMEYPVLVRPSYVLGGRAMIIAHTPEQLTQYMKTSTEITPERPVLIDAFLQNAIEIDVDALCDGNEVFVAGIMEHIEEAGVHSGDSACILPSRNISQKMLEEIKATTKALALELNVKGLINIQFAIFQEELYIIEVNPRASRTVPFVSKAIAIPLAKMATRIVCGESISSLNIKENLNPNLFYVKEVVLPFKKFPGNDTILGPEMKSTGEVLGVGETPAIAFYKAQEAASAKLPLSGTIFVSVTDESKPILLEDLKAIQQNGFKIVATSGTAQFLQTNGVEAQPVLKVFEGRPNIVDSIRSNEIDLIINIPADARTRDDALDIRLAALQYSIPYMTTAKAALWSMEGILETQKNLEVKTYPFMSPS